MNLPRRRFLHLAATAAVLSPFAAWGQAQNYPSKPVHIINGFAPGGGADITARLLAQWLSERMGQAFVVENRTGAGTNIATEAVINAPPDGYTLLFATGANLINATLYTNLKFNFIKDTAPIALLAREPNVLVLHPSVPANTLAEFIAYLKANPAKLTMATGGNGAPSHITGEMLKMLAGVDFMHIPYRGAGPALVGVLGGQAQAYFSPLSAAIENVKAGKLRAIAVTTTERNPAMPDLPAIAELVPRFDASQLYGISAPKNTPAQIIDKLNKEINAVLATPAAKARLAELGETPLGGTPADFAKLTAEETRRWGEVVKFSGARID